MASRLSASEGFAEDFDGAIAGGLAGEDAIEVQEQGGFAGAVRAEQTDAFAGRDLEAHAAQGFGAVVVTVFQVRDFDGGNHRQPRAHMAS